MPALAAFNPNPTIERVSLAGGQACFVIDNALLEPARLIGFAAERREQFRSVDFNAYPGILLPTPGEIGRALNEFFLQHIRRRFDARRIVHAHSRLALVTLPPQALRPRQWLCHRDSVGVETANSIQASVLYLFKDASLGGTSFYESMQPAEQIALLFHEASTMEPAEFVRKYGIEPGYMSTANRYFRCVGSVPAQWNRLIFYDGDMLHTGDIAAPEKLTPDPRTGRLTLNGFFTCRRNAI